MQMNIQMSTEVLETGTTLTFCQIPNTPTITITLELRVLGVMLDQTGSTETSLNFAYKRAMGHWMARSKQLLNPRVSYAARARRFYETIGASFLWGTQGWSLTRAQAHRVIVFENTCLRRMRRVFRRTDEDWVGWLKRSTQSFRMAMELTNIRGCYHGMR